MDKLKELLSACKVSVSIQINNHRDYYQTVKEHLEELSQFDEELISGIGGKTYSKMKETNTIVEIHAYPDTPIGSYRVFHHDIDEAISIMLQVINPITNNDV